MKSQETTPKEATKQLDSVDKALVLLECFSDREPELSLKQLSEKTGLYKSRIMRLCGTLMARGFLVRRAGSVYRLGPKLLMLGKIYERTSNLISLARPIMRELASLTGESTKLFVIQDDRRVCIAREEGSHPLRYAINEGDSLELYAGAGGKVLLAYAEDELRKRLFDQPLRRITAATIVAREPLNAELEAIRRQGYALSRGELVEEVAGMAAPVFDHSAAACAALTISGPVQRFSDENCQEMSVHLLAAARQISQSLGYFK